MTMHGADIYENCKQTSTFNAKHTPSLLCRGVRFPSHWERFTDRSFDLIVLSYSLGILGTGEHAKFYLDQTTCVQLLRKSLSLKSISLLKWTDIDCSIYSHVS